MKLTEPIVSDERFMLLLSNEEMKGRGFISSAQIAPLVRDDVALLDRGGKPVGAIPTGYKKLDDVITGFKRSDLIVVAAKHSRGKTGFVLGIAENAARKGLAVGIFSLDLAREKIMQRLIAIRTSIYLWRVITGELDRGDMKRIERCTVGFKKSPLYIDDEANLDILELRARATQLKNDHGLDLLVIDGFQFIRPLDEEPHNLDRIARGLKMIAAELNVPVVVTVDLEKKFPGHLFPRIHDLSRSGSLDRYAAMVLFLHPNNRLEDGIRDGEDASLLEVNIAKNNNGRIGTADLRFSDDLVSIVDAPPSFAKSRQTCKSE